MPPARDHPAAHGREQDDRSLVQHETPEGDRVHDVARGVLQTEGHPQEEDDAHEREGTQPPPPRRRQKNDPREHRAEDEQELHGAEQRRIRGDRPA
jgi:hypothetical protein